MEVLSYMIDVRGGRKGKREADQAAKGFDNLADSISDADKAAGRFIDASGRMREANGQFVAGAGGAQKASKGLGGELKSLGSKLNNVSGRLQLAVGGLLLFGPALLSVAASAAAAVTGAGIVGGAGLAALGVALGGVAGVAKSVIGQIDKVRQAQDAYNLALEQYGPASDEATAARQRFNAVLESNGGQRTLRMLEQINDLTKEWTDRTQPARRSLERLFSSALRGARRLLPVYAAETNMGAATVSRVGSSIAGQLSGKEMQRNLKDFGATGRALIKPLGQGLTDLFFALLRLLRPALPYIEKAARAFEDWAHSLRAAAGDGPKLAGFLAMLVGHFKSWWALARGLGRTLSILFSGSEKSGKGLVDSLTGVVDKMNDWLENAKATGRLAKFFQGAADGAAAILKVMAALALAVGAVYVAVQPYVPLISALAPYIDELVVALVAWKVVALVLALWAKRFLVQMFLLRTAIIVLRTIIALATAAQWLWNAAMLANPIGLIILAIVALIAGIVLLVKNWGWVKQAGVDAWHWIKQAAQDAWYWITDNWAKIVPTLLGPFGGLVAAIVKHFDGIKEAFRSALNWVIEKWNAVEFAVPTLKIKGHNVIPGGGSKIGVPDIPLLAEGGNVRARGAAIVGDNGPEVLDLPAGARVTPLDQGHSDPLAGREIALYMDRNSIKPFARAVIGEMTAGMARG